MAKYANIEEEQKKVDEIYAGIGAESEEGR